MNKTLLIILFGTLAISCTESKENHLETVDKKSAREVVLSTQVVGDSTLHISSQKIWVNSELIATRIDTIKTPTRVSSWDPNATTPTDLQKIPIYVTVE